MANLPDNDRKNQEKLMELLRVADPELFLIKQALLDTRINPVLVNQVLRSVGNLLIGSGFGKVEIYMQDRRIKNIKGSENVMIDEEAEVE